MGAEAAFISAGGYKSCFCAHSLHQFKSEYTTIEGEGTFQISDLQVNVADANSRINSVPCH
jgi:hypothetical protein